VVVDEEDEYGQTILSLAAMEVRLCVVVWPHGTRSWPGACRSRAV